tara:strand:- start:414 stop:536 length:123 start_codon:yes stop_codon:yes gene_type:complete
MKVSKKTFIKGNRLSGGEFFKKNQSLDLDPEQLKPIRSTN